MRRILLVILAVLLLTGCAGTAANAVDSPVTESSALSYFQISQDEAKQMMTADGTQVVVDVRRQDEYDAGHIPGAILIPNESIADTPPEELPMRTAVSACMTP